MQKKHFLERGQNLKMISNEAINLYKIKNLKISIHIQIGELFLYVNSRI